MSVVALDRAGNLVAVGVGRSQPDEDVWMEEYRRERLEVLRPPAPQDEPLGLESHKRELLEP